MRPYRFMPLATLACLSIGFATGEDSPMAIGMGAKVYAEQCLRCHEMPDPTTRDSRAWKAVSLHMRVFAYLSREEQQQVSAFLRHQNTVRDPAVNGGHL